MATHSSVLAWRIPGMGEPGGLPSMWSHRVGHDWSNLAIAAAWRLYHILWKDWCWSWNSNTLATWCKELTHLKRPWCWERLKAEGEGDDRGWDGWEASPTQWTWVWVGSRSWWWTGRTGVLQSMGSQRVGQGWATELNWTVETWHPVCPLPRTPYSRVLALRLAESVPTSWAPYSPSGNTYRLWLVLSFKNDQTYNMETSVQD